MNEEQAMSLAIALRNFKDAPPTEWERLYFELVGFITDVANSDEKGRNRLLAPFKTEKKRGRKKVQTAKNELEILELFEKIREHYQSAEGKRYSDDALLIKMRNAQSIRSHSMREQQMRKSFRNRLSEARKLKKSSQ